MLDQHTTGNWGNINDEFFITRKITLEEFKNYGKSNNRRKGIMVVLVQKA
jgi:hypothetical protein